MQNVSSIGESAFNSCTSLTSVGNLQKLTTIGNFAFSWCTSLASVDLRNISSIGESAFYSCYSLKTIRVPRDMIVPASKWGATGATIVRY